MHHQPFLLLIILLCFSCSKPVSIEPTTDPPITNPSTFAKGADASWVTEMEANSYKFYDTSGNQKECFAVLKGLGMNAIRLRIWVNPQDGYCNLNDVIAKATRANALGMKTFLDFHYSDTWADPGNQTKPASWNNQDISTLKITLNNYTVQVLTSIKNVGVTPSWVQIGNETNDGMLWPEGKASTNMANFSGLINAGYSAVKQVFPDCKVVVHVSNGYDNSLFRYLFDGLTSNHTNYDVIGMSLYPTAGNWEILNQQCLNNMKDMISRYNKQIMICEVGMPVSDSVVCKSFLSDIISKTRSLPNNSGLGVFYWEPEAYKSWKGYKLGAFSDFGRPGPALYSFF